MVVNSEKNLNTKIISNKGTGFLKTFGNVSMKK